MLTLDEAKAFLRIEHDEENDFIASLVQASETFIINATDTNADKTSELFKLAQRLLVVHWYENRQTVIVGRTTKALDYALDSLLFQIQMTAGDDT